jgi:hypothetical protein
MDERIPPADKPPNLKVAVRRARAESADRTEAQEHLRQAETARLALLEDAIRPVFDEIPDDADVFDLGLSHGDRPRLFLDMISFIDLAHDRRTYRFFQDTRHGRVLIAESDSPDRILAAVTNYVARRLIEREQALAADWRSRTGPEEPAPEIAAKPTLAARARAWVLPSQRRPIWRLATEAFGFLLMTLGSVTLCVGLFLLAQMGWEAWGRAFWTAHVSSPPF